MRANPILILAAVTALAGCASGAAATAQRSTLVVRMAMYGGPLLPDGHMALDGRAAPGEPITVTDARGRTWPTRTGPHGAVTLRLPAGHYRVTSSYCGQPVPVWLRDGRPAAALLRCDVP